jgi:acetyl-CoA synthetase
MSSTEAFKQARDFLLAHREDYETAYREFRWPDLDEFNWATDWVDVIAAERPDDLALWVVHEDGPDTRLTFGEVTELSRRFAGSLAAQGVQRGDRVLLLLGNVAPLWVVMLGCIRLGAVMIPASTLLSAADLEDRLARGRVKAIVSSAADARKFGEDSLSLVRVMVGEIDPTDGVEGWLSYAAMITDDAPELTGGGTRAGDPLLLYFTSGTTALPKLVEHTHASYPVGHLSTMYWIGLQPGDLHLNVSSPGWAKHAWSCLFAPWNAGATIVIFNAARFDADALLEVMSRVGVTTFCAPPTVWRMVTQTDMAAYPLVLRECVGAGEPLNPEVIQQVQRAWGITIRDGFGQTETTCQIGNPPGQPLKPGSMGRPLPGYVVSLVDPATDVVGRDGEICLELARRPLGLMTGYDDEGRTSDAMRAGFYHTGDVASQDDDGYITYVGRADDVFKASDYRISPFELESVLIEHPAVAEAAVVPSPDPVRLAVPKAFVVLAPGQQPSRELAGEILAYARDHLAAFKRIRRLEFADLPKTISGKIRRVELREDEAAAVAAGRHGEHAYTEDDFPRPGR